MNIAFEGFSVCSSAGPGGDYADAVARHGFAIEDGDCVEVTRVWCDSFDWRLYGAGLRLYGDRIGARWHWVLAREAGVEARWESRKLPVLASDLPPGAELDELRGVLRMRALLPVVESAVERRDGMLLDGLQKRVGELVVERERVGACVLTVAGVTALRGFGDELRALHEAVAASADEGDRLKRLLAAIGRRPLDYSSKFRLQLVPEQDADAAIRAILWRLLETMERNESGTIANLDSEFLHDFRVAIRRLRAALSRLKGVLDPAATAGFKADLAWLGQVTGPPRDADVYLLKLPQYKALLPVNHADDLAPLEPLLRRDRSAGYRSLRKALQSDRYAAFKAEFREFLSQPGACRPLPPWAARPVLTYARNRIWKTYKRVVAEARGITTASPDEALHDLRKSFKKLRYVTEFFASLFPDAEMKPYLKVLRRVQDNLGDFNDYAVQLEKLQSLAERLRRSPEVPTSALLAMGALAYRMEADARNVRREFAKRFAKFDEPASRRRVRDLFRLDEKEGEL